MTKSNCTLRRLHIHTYTFFIPIETHKITSEVRAPDIRGTPTARLIASARMFHLQNLSAQIPEQLSAIRAGDDPRQVEDATSPKGVGGGRGAQLPEGSLHLQICARTA